MRFSRIAIGFVILVAILATIPWIDGYFFKQNYYNFVKALEADKTLNIKILEYHQGWFSSEAKISMTPTDIARMPPSNVISNANTHPSIVFDQKISHGPIAREMSNNSWTIALATIQSKVRLPANVEAILLGNQSNQNGIMESNAIVTLGGDYLTQFRTPVFTINIFGVNLVWQGLNGNMNFYMNGRRLQKMTTDMSIGDFVAKGLSSSIVMKEASVKYDISPDAKGFWNGTYHFDVPEFTFSRIDEVYSIRGIKTSYVFGSAAPNLYNTTIQLSLGQFTSPQFSINPASMNLSFENISNQGLLNLIKAINQLKNSKDELTPAQSQQLLMMVPQLITTTTRIKENVAINTSYGRALWNAQISWPSVVKTLSDVIKVAKGKADLRISASLVDQLIVLVATYEAANMPKQNAPSVMQQPTEQNLLKQIDSWMNENKLDLSVGIQIKDLIQTKLTPVDFSTNIEKFIKLKQISVEMGEQLKVLYATVRSNPQPVQTAVAAPISPVNQLKDELNMLIKQGLIKQDTTDYVTTITLEQGIIKANGLEVQRLM